MNPAAIAVLADVAPSFLVVLVAHVTFADAVHAASPVSMSALTALASVSLCQPVLNVPLTPSDTGAAAPMIFTVSPAAASVLALLNVRTRFANVVPSAESLPDSKSKKMANFYLPYVSE